MAASAQTTWLEMNQRYLTAGIAYIRALLERHVARSNDGETDPNAIQTAREEMDATATAMTAPPALDVVSAIFGLSVFERDTLLLCAATEFDGAIATLCAAAHGDPQRPHATFGLALAALPGPHWSALAPTAPLRHWRLADFGATGGLTRAPLRLDERILHYVAGVRHLDARLSPFVDPLGESAELMPSHRALADRLAANWRSVQQLPMPVAQLCGPDPAAKRTIAMAACDTLGLPLHRMRPVSLPTAAVDLDTVIALWNREVLLGGCTLYLDCESLDETDSARTDAIASFIERIRGPVIVAQRERQPIGSQPSFALDVPAPMAAEQGAAWHAALGPAAAHLNGHVGALVAQFSLSPAMIRAAAADVGPHIADADPQVVGDLLWDACRVRSRVALDHLALRIESGAGWDDLVLPEQQRDILQQIAAHVRQRARVYYEWGFADKGARGLGISALFAGASGTGKTMAAEVLANALRLDLYRIDLSAVVSKYIGETEKNLRRVFDAAEGGGAILLFDEADALFGKRSEVKDSHDRYANIEVGYLLQRMEAYRGLAILTTNLKSALDTAFLRRLRFVVHFPFPDAAQRAEIWRRIFPAATPTESLPFASLARLNVAGGNIRNIALHAAFLAAEAHEPVRAAHVLQAARTEYAKLEKPLTEAEIGDWR
jgi:ATPase family associated with various cellular activities (AAA)/Winged helix domain, variant